MEEYLKIVLCIWGTLAIIRLSIDFLTTGYRYKHNTEMLDLYNDIREYIKFRKGDIIT